MCSDQVCEVGQSSPRLSFELAVHCALYDVVGVGLVASDLSQHRLHVGWTQHTGRGERKGGQSGLPSVCGVGSAESLHTFSDGEAGCASGGHGQPRTRHAQREQDDKEESGHPEWTTNE